MDGNRNIININNNNNERAHQEQEEEEPLPQPQITVLLTPEGQKVRSILNTKLEELPLYFINNINELMNDIAAGGEFLPIVRTLVADDLFVRDEQHRQEDEQRAHQQDEEGELLQPRIVLLTPEGQNVRSILAKKLEDLPQCVINKINERMNDIAAAGEFLTKVRTSLVDDLFVRNGQHRREQQQQTRGLTTAITDKEEWPKEEKRYETAFRLFPDILLEEKHGYNLIQWLTITIADDTYRLKDISLIPLVLKLGIELQQFDTELRGGLLSLYPSGQIPLQRIIGYGRNEHTTNTTDECFSVVVERLREENLLVKEDIQQYNVGERLFTQNNDGFFLESQVQCLIDMDPMTLSLPCSPEKGNWLPIHWSTSSNKDIQVFNFLLKEGMKYFPGKFGFVFCGGTHRNSNGKIFRKTPFQRACKKYGHAKVMNGIMIYVAKYCSITSTSTMTATATAATSTTTKTTSTTTGLSLLMSAVTEESIHIDCLYILLRTDITAGLLRLQQHLQQQELEEGDGDEQTVPEINIDNDNIDSNNMEITGDSTTTSTFLSMLMSTSSLENIAAITAVATVSSPMANKNKNNNSLDDNNNNEKHQQSLTKRKKRKQHEMR